jgi:Na+-transporting methylmalonyl-CoA/oxaloacetate decarboxylase gamma subunit
MNDLLLSLQITGLGMGLVFGAILLLWMMMSLLTLFTAERETAPAPDLKPGPVIEADGRAQAAALAVALALAEQQISAAHPLVEPPTALVSAWQLGMRARQMSEKGNFRRKGRR